METKWLEDFVSLAETRSFSRSAQLRHVTQPAFSRRIQALEAWVGTDLIDRSTYPTRLTPAGETFYAQALEILGTLQTTRSLMRGHHASGRDVIELAVPHSLAFTFVPQWLSRLSARFGPVRTRLIALNVHDASMRLVEGSCDLLVAFHHALEPLQLDPDRYDMLSLGGETLAPYARPDEHGRPLYTLPGSARRPVPFLAYASGAYLGRLVGHLLKRAGVDTHLDPIYTTDMAEGLKAMAMEGHGLAFLPSGTVRQELRSRRLVPAGGERPQAYTLSMEIRIYRARPETQRAGRGPDRRAGARALWAHLEEVALSGEYAATD